jgi:type IV secretory pathway VirD2 relaxase
MPGRRIDPGSPPLLDIHTYGRPALSRTQDFTPAQIEYIRPTVHRAPEVMVKVLSRGGQNLKAVARHLNYLSRDGEVEIETDDGRHLKGEGTEEALIEDWDLDLDQVRPSVDLKPRASPRPAPKLVHKLMFSMPAGTPAQKVLAAVQTFAREELGAKHRYAMVLHTDERHPHVHLVVKAMSEEGERLNIRKATLREWRAQFARRLRDQGVAANATYRAARGAMQAPKLDGIHRAAMRAASTHYCGRVDEAARELALGTSVAEPGKHRLLATRRVVIHGWKAVSDQLATQGQLELAQAVRAFVAQLPQPRTEKELIKAALLEMGRARDPQDRYR